MDDQYLIKVERPSVFHHSRGGGILKENSSSLKQLFYYLMDKKVNTFFPSDRKCKPRKAEKKPEAYRKKLRSLPIGSRGDD
jgi:hypothetical protein